MDPKVLFHSCTKFRLDTFKQRPKRTVSFTSNPRAAYGQVLRLGKEWQEDLCVVVLTEPYHYYYVPKGGSGEWYSIHLSSSPIDITNNHVVVIENPTLEQLCEYVPRK